MNKPFTIIYTSQQCSHCNHFRGDGKPSEDKDWSPTLIKKILGGSTSVSEIHLDKMKPTFDNIIQFNEYTINNNSLVRTIFSKENGKIKYNVEVNGLFNLDKSNQLKLYVWNLQLPLQLKKIRSNIIEGKLISPILKENPENEHVKNIFKLIKKKLTLEEYDELLDNEFDFKWWLNNNVPQTLGLLVPFYPCWIFVDINEWIESLKTKTRPIYGHVSSCNVLQLSNGSYEVKMLDEIEDPLETLKNVNSGKYSLFYKK